jgi:hypothetical protein
MQHIITQRIDSGGRTHQYAKTYEAESVAAVEVAVADSESDKEIDIAIDYSQITSLWISSDQDVTIETNDGTTPDDTIALKANVPLLWTTDSYFACPLTEDVTALFVTNASGSTATVRVEVLTDPTP